MLGVWNNFHEDRPSQITSVRRNALASHVYVGGDGEGEEGTFLCSVLKVMCHLAPQADCCQVLQGSSRG
jgi:hypothetical protein